MDLRINEIIMLYVKGKLKKYMEKDNEYWHYDFCSR